MTLATFSTLYYTFIHILPFSCLIFYTFRTQLRWGVLPTSSLYLLLLSGEVLVQVQFPNAYNQQLSLLLQLLYLLYPLLTIKAFAGKVLAISLLTLPLAFLTLSLARIAEAFFPTTISYLTANLVITVIVLSFIYPTLVYIRQVLRPLLDVQEKKPWLYLAAYELVLIFIVLLIDPWHQTLAPRVLVSRFLLLVANIACVQIMVYLCQSIHARDYTRNLLNSLQVLQEFERQRYADIMERWRSSRRLRHDLQSHILTVLALAKASSQHELKRYLQEISTSLSSKNKIK